MSLPKSLPNPFYFLTSLNTTINFEVKFIVDNKSENQFDVSIYLKSNTQAVGFFLDEEKTVWKRHYLILPYRESIALLKDNFIEQSVGPLHETTFTFSAIYRPK